MRSNCRGMGNGSRRHKDAVSDRSTWADRGNCHLFNVGNEQPRAEIPSILETNSTRASDACAKRRNTRQFGAVLQQVAAESIRRGSAYLAGEIIGPRGRLFSGSNFTALYVSPPVYFPSEFAEVLTENIGHVIFAWLVPIPTEEANYVTRNGWSKFEHILNRENPDLLDLCRLSSVT